ncbi:hypothetical protein GQ607_016217 [Colletotrichum asianum]|uniref:Uncharacterized protein n=1 Tax=Colletotrichum asianum TaxID=702518 RepID=A0A8H3ZK65_9PEZI|nr:hypothetical protein GQ607_016217 [Colletotrichum asianum]
MAGGRESKDTPFDQLRCPTRLTKPADSSLFQSHSALDDQPVLRDVGRPSRSSRMASSDQSEKICHARTSSLRSLWSHQTAAKSAHRRPSLSEFYTYVPSDCSLSGCVPAGSQRAHSMPRPQAPVSDCHNPAAHGIQVYSPSEDSLKEAEGSPQEGIGGANLQTDRFRRRS